MLRPPACPLSLAVIALLAGVPTVSAQPDQSRPAKGMKAKNAAPLSKSASPAGRTPGEKSWMDRASAPSSAAGGGGGGGGM